MGWLTQERPQVDYATWARGSFSEKIKPMARHWAEVGFGTPVVLHLFYVAKICLYILGGLLIAVATPGIGGITDVGSWYDEPIVFQKVVLYTMLVEVVGLGCAFGPLNNRYYPPFGSILYWLRPRTIRQPPWPTRVPLTRGDERTPIDVALYAALLVLICIALSSGGAAAGLLPTWQVWAILGVLAALGLRDKTIFLAARGEVYGAFTVTFLFTATDLILAAKLVCLAIWIGAATSKLTRHFPYVLSTMMSNNPLLRTKRLKRSFFRSFPDDLRPGWRARGIAHLSTAIEGLVPVVLFFSGETALATIALVLMLIFHFGILSAIPMGVPLEWNVFMMFAAVALFAGHGDVGLGDIEHPWILALLAVQVTIVVVGNLSPRRVSFLPGMRYYAGNWDTSLWCMKASASAKLEAGIVSIAAVPASQLERIYGGLEGAHMAMFSGYAFRAFNTHGKALFTLSHRARAGQDEADYVLTDGERICSMAMGWNFGDGHLSDEQLLGSLQRRCAFEPGEVRVVMLEAQPLHRQRQRYRIVDAATGEFERGHVLVADMVDRQPWDDDIPVTVTSSGSAR